MKRILITGMSGTGKSAIVAELELRGYQAIDLDTPDWSEWVPADANDVLTPGDGEDWVWREDRVRSVLSSRTPDVLFVSGCAQNMDRLLNLIDTVVLLSAPVTTIMDRLSARTEGYGQSEVERLKVSELIATVEPLLREVATFEIDTRQSVSDTTAEILRRVA